MDNTRLPPDVFEAVLNALRDALVAEYRMRFVDHPPAARSVASTSMSPWLTVHDAAARARCGTKTLQREVAAGRLHAVRVGGRRSLRFRAEWIDQWLESSARSGQGPRADSRARVLP